MWKDPWGFFDAHSGSFNALFGGLVALFTLLLFLNGRDQHNRLAESIQLGREEFVASNRPWIFCKDPKLGFGLVRNEDGRWGGLLQISLLNSGRSPAIDVRCAVKAVKGNDTLAIDKGIADLRAEVADQKLALKLAVFPGQKHRILRTLSIPPEAVTPPTPLSIDNAVQMTPVILVAVSYRFEGAGEPFETGFGYAMMMDEFLIRKSGDHWPVVGLRGLRFEDVPEGSYAT